MSCLGPFSPEYRYDTPGSLVSGRRCAAQGNQMFFSEPEPRCLGSTIFRKVVKPDMDVQCPLLSMSKRAKQTQECFILCHHG